MSRMQLQGTTTLRALQSLLGGIRICQMDLPGCLPTDSLAVIRVIGEQGVKEILSDFARPDRNLNRSRFELFSGAKYIILGSHLGLLVKLDLSSLHVKNTRAWYSYRLNFIDVATSQSHTVVQGGYVKFQCGNVCPYVACSAHLAILLQELGDQAFRVQAAAWKLLQPQDPVDDKYLGPSAVYKWDHNQNDFFERPTRNINLLRYNFLNSCRLSLAGRGLLEGFCGTTALPGDSVLRNNWAETGRVEVFWHVGLNGGLRLLLSIESSSPRGSRTERTERTVAMWTLNPESHDDTTTIESGGRTQMSRSNYGASTVEEVEAAETSIGQRSSTVSNLMHAISCACLSFSGKSVCTVVS
ncbi:hypothetical protein HD553DRAFT_324031 [Filobasidium floriforme]|uniref:uncharacterized protein n=1 Tax=Filobasidium floriforme TaxID=5210 RepID=UPI001E8EB171|nr:uncharacterized protein HD553DRAFT_324031 [Filobasidium floriforme]KAH8084686.1 hypothetical protein HD553DRAFT_324031 [Filobasidium floriforme]